jgi:hypothetical protein
VQSDDETRARTRTDLDLIGARVLVQLEDRVVVLLGGRVTVAIVIIRLPL